MSINKRYVIILLVVGLLVVFGILALNPAIDGQRNVAFNSERAMEDVVYQVSLGPRTPGSPAHAQVQQYILSELDKAGWTGEVISTQYGGQRVENIIAKQRPDSRPGIILGAHYDTRFTADNDPDPGKRNLPVPGANDGASGVAVLLELSRSLKENSRDEIWLVFFDAEDNGRIPGWDWILGSRSFVENLDVQPDAAVIVDMVGDADLNLYYEKSSDAQLSQQIWEQAAKLGYGSQFIPQLKHTILDDHVPFLEVGIPAVDIIDIDYPYWHTTADTVDKIAPASLQAVGDTLQAWLENSSPLAK